MPRSSNGSGRRPFKPVMRVRVPCGVLGQPHNTRPVSETGHHATLRTSYSGFESWAGYSTRDEGEMAPRLAWDQETAGSSPAIPTSLLVSLTLVERGSVRGNDAARSFNGRGRLPDKAETKVRLLLGLFGSHTTTTGSQPCRQCIDLNRYPHLSRGRGVAAAQRSFKPHGEGSSPSGLI